MDPLWQWRDCCAGVQGSAEVLVNCMGVKVLLLRTKAWLVFSPAGCDAVRGGHNLFWKRHQGAYLQALLSDQDLQVKVKILQLDLTAAASLRSAVFEILLPFAFSTGWMCTASWSVDAQPAVWAVGVVTSVATMMMMCGAGLQLVLLISTVRFAKECVYICFSQ